MYLLVKKSKRLVFCKWMTVNKLSNCYKSLWLIHIFIQACSFMARVSQKMIKVFCLRRLFCMYIHILVSKFISLSLGLSFIIVRLHRLNFYVKPKNSRMLFRPYMLTVFNIYVHINFVTLYVNIWCFSIMIRLYTSILITLLCINLWPTYLST